MQSASGLSTEDFTAFVHDCELDFGYRPLEPAQDGSREDARLQEDADHVAQVLFATVADRLTVIELSRDQLLARLDWTSRFEFRSRHEFPVDEALYQPNSVVADNLARSLEALPGGYVAVLGTPGSGKSTFLTQTLRARPERVLRYYAYVPDAQDAMPLRGEAANFIHDMVLALERAGFRERGGFGSTDRDSLLKCFHRQLRRLHDDWVTTGRKTILLIDGLDHIDREQHPSRSLLADLPLPGQVPEGVFIILGSQTDAPFPPRIQAAVRQPQRRIEMLPLGRESVLRLLNVSPLAAASTVEQREQIFRLSAGHPLALLYLLQRIGELSDSDTVQVALDSVEQFGGNIDEQYHGYWRQIELDAALLHLLGLLARLRGAIDLDWVETWADHTLITAFSRSAAHYFRRETESRWYFFHNSFRLFLIARTASSLSGTFSNARHTAFHRELAGHAAATPATTRWSWEELYHRVQAEEHDAVLARAKPEWFRAQLRALRPIEAIQTDILLALRSAAARRDPVALTQLLLAGAEYVQRKNHLREADVISLLVALGNGPIAAEYLRDGIVLRTDANVALRASVTLRQAALLEESRRVFELAEPLHLFNILEPQADHVAREQDNLLIAWAETAVHFRDIGEVVRLVSQVRRPNRRPDDEAADATRPLRCNLLFHAGLSLLKAQQWPELELVAARLSDEYQDEPEWWFWLQMHAWHDRWNSDDRAQARSIIEQVLARADAAKLSPEARVDLAEGVYRVLEDRQHASTLLEDVDQPELLSKARSFNSDKGMRPFQQRFRLNRLRYALGEQRTPANLVPDSDDPRDRGAVLFERAVCTVARVWGRYWGKQPTSGALVVAELFPLLHLFDQPPRITRDWNSWHVVSGAKIEFCELIVHTAKLFGGEAVEALRSRFEQEWNTTDSPNLWFPDLQRHVIVCLHEAGVSREWAGARLRLLDGSIPLAPSIFERVLEAERQANAWLRLGERELATHRLRDVLDQSFGVASEEAYQLDDWIGWLRMRGELHPQAALADVTWFARAAVALGSSTQGDSTESAANALLGATFRLSPRHAVQLFHWFLVQRSVNYPTAFLTILQAALDGPDPPIALVTSCLAEAYLPLAEVARPEIAALLVARATEIGGERNTVAVVRKISTGIRTWAISSTRAGWFHALAEALRQRGIDPLQAGVDLSPGRTESEDRSSSSALRLQDGTTLSDEEVRARLDSIQAVRVLLESEAKDSYYSWERPLKVLLQSLLRSDLFVLAEMFGRRHHAALILAEIGERLIDLGARSDAWAVGERALAASEHYGWARRYDGGTRIRAFRVLVRADANRARPMVYDALLADLRNDFPQPDQIVRNLDELLSLLTDPIPTEELWPIVGHHARSLFEATVLPEATPWEQLEVMPDNTSARALTELVVAQLTHPVVTIAQSFQRVVGQRLLANDATMQLALGETLDTGEAAQESVIMVLDAVGQRDMRVLMPFRGHLARLASSPNYALRSAARTLLDRFGEDIRVDRRSNPLPSVYTIALPPGGFGRFINIERAPATNALPDTDDPSELVRPFDWQLDIIARLAGLPALNLHYRTIQIMQGLAPPATWLAQGERAVRADLDAAGLRLTFRRPRTLLARRAMFHVVAELIDVKPPNPDSLRFVEEMLRYYDPALVLMEPMPCPSTISPIIGRDDLFTKDAEWLDAVEDVFPLVNSVLPDGRAVLAEQTELCHLDWKHPTELRLAKIALILEGRPDPRDEWERFFSRVTNELVEEYPLLTPDDDPPPLIIRHAGFAYDSPHAFWLALNPVVGQELGWSPSADNPLIWQDEKGELMVESVRWVDGPMIQDKHSDRYAQVGEGWLVVATATAMARIMGRYPMLKRIIAVERQMIEERETTRRWSIREESISLTAASPPE